MLARRQDDDLNGDYLQFPGLVQAPLAGVWGLKAVGFDYGLESRV